GLSVLALGSVGCTVVADPVPAAAPVAVVESEPVVYADVAYAPAEIDIRTAPRAYYGGHPVYSYQDHWYYREHARWAYHPREPRELYGRRAPATHGPPSSRYYAHHEVHVSHVR